MKRILLILLLFVSLQGFSQSGFQGYLTNNSYRGISASQKAALPSDTFAVGGSLKSYRWIAIKNGTIWLWQQSENKWESIGGGTSEPSGDYLTLATANALYQPIGSYLTTASANLLYQPVGTYLTLASAASTFQPIGSYLTTATANGLYQPIGSYLSAATAAATYQPIGNFFRIQDTASQFSKYLRSWDASTLYQLKGNYQAAGNYVTVSDTATMLNKYLRIWNATTLYQPLGTTVRFSDSASMLSPYLRSNVAASLYQPIGGGGGSNYKTLVTLGADVTNSTTTIANVTGLSFAVVANTTYRFYIIIPYTAAATTTGSRWTLTAPANTIFSYTSKYTLTATTQTVNYASANDIPAAANASSLTVGNLCIIEGVVRPSANGTVQVRFGSEVAASAIVAKAGATIEHW